MNKNIEPAQTPPSVTRQTPKWIPKWGIVALITIFSRLWLSHHADADVTLRAVVALVPIIFWFILARSAEKKIRLLDEMQRLMIYEAWFFAGIGTIFVLMALMQVKLAVVDLPVWLNHGLDYQGMALLISLLVFVGVIRSQRRYK